MAEVLTIKVTKIANKLNGLYFIAVIVNNSAVSCLNLSNEVYFVYLLFRHLFSTDTNISKCTVL